MKPTAVAWSITAALVAGTLPWAHADGSAPAAKPQGAAHLTLEINHASKAEAAKRLGEALGGEVRFEGTIPETLSVSLKDATVPAALKRVAAAVGGDVERVFRLSKSEAASAAPAARTGMNLALRLKDTPCAAAAQMVARMANARIESEGEIAGTVSLGGEEVPLEEVLDTIARSAGMKWRPVYIFRVAAAAAAPRTSPPPASRPKDPRAIADAKQAENPHQMTAPKGHTRRPATGRPPRTKHNQLGDLGAKAPAPKPPRDAKKAEELARLGQTFGSIFSFEDKEERMRRIKQLRSSLETAARRLDTFEPRYRVAGLQIQMIHLQQLVLDFDALNDEQKKEVEPIMEFVNDRLKEAATITRDHR
jgi:hypothetical protein